MKFIADYKEGEKFSGTYLCKSKQTLKTKVGKSYYSLSLQDKSGLVDAKVWELNNGIANFEAMDFIYVEGLVTVFQGNMQVNVNRIRKSQEGEYDPADYIPTSKKDIKDLYEQLLSFGNSINNKYLSQLFHKFFKENNDFKKRFCTHSAAKTVHHSFMGGLLEHTVAVTKMCDFFSSHYPLLNRDLLITAAIFHDIGKLEEIASFPQNDYTDAGQLLGHIYIGTERISRAIDTIDHFPIKLADELRHCLLAHHGKLEFGSPKTPALAEAFALNLADNADAKLQTLTEVFGAAGENRDWLGYNRILESNIRQTTE